MDTFTHEPQQASKPRFSWAYLFFFLFEGIVLFIIILASMSWSVWQDIVLLGRGSFDGYLQELILNGAYSATWRIFAAYAFVRYIAYFIHTRLTDFRQYSNLNRVQQAALWVFIFSALTITFVPLRLIVQDVVLEPSDNYVTGILVPFSFSATLWILGLLGVATSFFLYVFRTRSKRFFIWLAFAPVVAGLLLSFFNYGPDYIGTIYEARAAWKEQNYEKLFDKANEALAASETDEEKVTAYYWMGVSYNLRQLPEEAVEALNKAITFDPESADVYSSLSNAQGRLGQYEEARASAEKCISLNEKHPWCYYAMGASYYFEGNYADALVWVRKALELDPSSREMRPLLEWLEENQGVVE